MVHSYSYTNQMMLSGGELGLIVAELTVVIKEKGTKKVTAVDILIT